jgi:Phosphotransferase enzyme family
VLATVEEMLECVGVDAGGVVAEELTHNRWLSPGVWRVRTSDGRLAVLKYTRSGRSRGSTPWEAHWTARDHDPRRWTYWCREPLAYQHDLAGAYAGTGITAPACLGVHVDRGEAVLLLEWAAGEPGEDWPAASYGTAAEALGRAQAPFLGGRPLPSASWLSQGFLREYSSEKPVQWELLDDNEAWAHPVVRQAFPAGLREGVLFVHAHRERLYQISESLPRALCHLDVWPKNLFLRPGGQVTVIDWSFAGDGAIGEDAGNLVPDAAFDHFIAASDLPGLEQAALTLAQVRDDRQYRYGGAGEIDPVFKFRERSRVLLFNAGWARQAVELADRLGLLARLRHAAPPRPLSRPSPTGRCPRSCAARCASRSPRGSCLPVAGTGR